MQNDTDSIFYSKGLSEIRVLIEPQNIADNPKKAPRKPRNPHGSIKYDAQKIIARAVFLTGSIEALHKFVGISKSTLRSVATGRHKPNLSTILRLQSFIMDRESKKGRPFKKEGHKNG